MTTDHDRRAAKQSGRAVASGVILVAFALILVAYLAWQWTSTKPVEDLDRAVAPVSAEGGEELASLESSAAPEKAKERQDAGHELTDEASATIEESAQSVADDRLTGVVLDERDEPIAGARVTLDYRGSGGMNILDLAYARERHAVGETFSDESGAFSFEVPAGLSMRLTAGAPRHSRAIVEEAFGGEHHVLRLGAAALLRGRITRASDGSPAEAVDLRVWSANTRRTWGEMTTGPNGEYAFDDLPADVIVMSVESPNLMDAEWATFEIKAGEQTVRDYALLDGVRIHGRITDAKSGNPIEGCKVGAGWTFDKLAMTDADGRYEIRGFGSSGVYDIHVRGEGFGTAVHEFPYTEMPTEDVELDFVLRAARSARGRVVDREGKPIAGVYAAAIAEVGERVDWTSATTNAAGEFELDSLDPEGWHYLYLRKRGFGSRTYHFPETERDNSTTELGTLTLLPGGSVNGRVVDAQGRPLPGARVTLKGTNSDLLHFRPDGGTRADTRNVERQSTTSGQGGRFHFIDLAAADYSLSARLMQNVESARARVLVDPEQDAPEVELVIDLGLSISGHVVSASGEGVVGLLVRAATGNRSERVTCVTTGGGSFLLQGLKDQSYDLVADVTFIDDPDELMTTTIFPGHHAGEQDLRLLLDVPAEISGQVLAIDGQPAVKPFLNAYQGRHHLDFTVADEEGRFSFNVPSKAMVRVQAMGTKPAGSSMGRDFDAQAGTGATEASPGSRDIVIQLAE